jgi:hypothetical protein
MIKMIIINPIAKIAVGDDSSTSFLNVITLAQDHRDNRIIEQVQTYPRHVPKR